MASSGTIPPQSSVHEWHLPSMGRQVPDFEDQGQGGPSGPEYQYGRPPVRLSRKTRVPDTHWTSYGVDLQGDGRKGPSSWEKLLQEMDKKQLGSVGAINQRAGIREEQRSNLDLKRLKFRQPLVSSARRASLTGAP